jgi:hypothetical protein
VIASAAVGALLQNRLALALHDEAVIRSAQLPAGFRPAFVDGFSHAGHAGFEVGAGQTGSSLQLPPGVPQQVVVALQDAAHYVFTHAFVDAMRPSLILPISLLIVAALATVFVRADGSASAAEASEERVAVA